MGDQVFVRWTVIENLYMLGRLNENFRMGRGKSAGAEQAGKQKESRAGTRDSDEKTFLSQRLALLAAQLLGHLLTHSRRHALRHSLHGARHKASPELRVLHQRGESRLRHRVAERIHGEEIHK